MKPSQVISTHRSALRALSERYGLQNPRVFGSTARGEDTTVSDVDLMVDPTPNVTTYFDLADFRAEAESLLGVAVDVRTPADLHDCIRSRALKDAIPL